MSLCVHFVKIYIVIAKVIHKESFTDNNVHLRIFLQLGKHDSQNVLVN